MATILSKHFEKELQLSHFTIDNLQEAVFWINASGNIFQVNEMASKMSGYSKKELTKKHIIDLNPNPVAADFDTYW